MKHIIGIVSGKGGVGKTTIVVNLATALLELGKRVVIVDGNLTASNLGLHLGLIDYPATIHDVLKGDMKMIDAVFIHPTKLHVISGSLALADARKVSPKTFKRHLKDLLKYYDYVLVDTAPGLEDKSLKIIECCDNVIVITTLELPSITDAVRIVELVRKLKLNIVGIIINKRTGKKYEVTPEEIRELYKVPIIGIIPNDEEVPKSLSMQVPVVFMNPSASSSKEFMRIAKEIAGASGTAKVKRKPKKLFGKE